MPNNVWALNGARMLHPDGALKVSVAEKIERDRRYKTVLLEVITISIFQGVVLEPAIGSTADIVELRRGERTRLTDFNIILCVVRDIVIRG